MDKSRAELITECKARGIRGYSGKKKVELIALLGVYEEKEEINTIIGPISEKQTSVYSPLIQQEVVVGDCIEVMAGLMTDSAQIVIADPPYNIGKDFGNDSDRQPMDVYLAWCDLWIGECLRILKPNGTMFIYGFSEVLALILARIPSGVKRRWLIWHYTNKNVASLNFWQRSHESILVLWKEDKVFHRDEVREPYTEGFLTGAAGRRRAATQGRFSREGAAETVYTAHPAGALPRDVIKIPALAGGAGAKERVAHPTQKPLILCEKLLRSCQQGANGGLVVVPFAGSGSECVAAQRLGLPFLGIELNEEYCELAKGRLAAEEGI